MQGNFTYHNPTKLVFGKDALDGLAAELAQYGPRVQLAYGGGSIKKTGLYDRVIAILREAGKEVFEDAGVMPNPTVEKLREGAAIARDNDVDLILAVGGGSVVDYAKAVGVSAHCEEDPWEKYYLRMEEPECRIVPVGCILTMAGTGSEMNGGAVITNHDSKLKIGHVFANPEVFPRFAILNPELTYTVPKYQMIAGIFDIMSHLMEQYFSGVDDSTSDYLMEGLMRSLVQASRAAVANPTDYEARSNIMWTATWALNTLVAKGKATDWEVHMIGQAIGAYTDATHGMTLSAVSPAYYRHIMPHGLEKFARFARTVWEVSVEGRTPEELAAAGIDALEAWMREIGCVMSVAELGVTDDMLEGIADATFIMEGGYKVLAREDVLSILRASK
ncbi:NADH-dependent alcohol dehydrogenase [Rubneribacter badeniensis]|uniref:NADH-dependent alcohol dehydrogenase n=1 Tax=Rubneribacter badeniensis TaxID=2070688 RepID=A0A2K2U2P3_9ACTN|nr:iron-containing alcohol dehydrogenase [Rubneribacter badeniensis]PNV64522.1 NADH-dependent alcohol dehydrogenase [Rubneribacter badeniensis]